MRGTFLVLDESSSYCGIKKDKNKKSYYIRDRIESILGVDGVQNISGWSLVNCFVTPYVEDIHQEQESISVVVFWVATELRAWSPCHAVRAQKLRRRSSRLNLASYELALDTRQGGYPDSDHIRITK